MSNWSDEDRLIAADFLTTEPPLADYPHLIFKAARSTLELTLRVVNAKGGLWCQPPPFDANGKETIAQEWSVVQHFRLWEQSRNQEHLLNTGWGILTATEFTMVIAANTQPELLAEMASASTCFGEHPTFDWRKDFESLALWVDRLGWAYVPLKHGEHDHALFLTRKNDKQWGEALQMHLFSAGCESARLRRIQERIHWDGPMVL